MASRTSTITPLLRYRLSDPLGNGTRVSAFIITLAGAGLTLFLPVEGVVLVAIGLFPFMYYKQLEIDEYKGTYCIGITLFGKTLGKREPFPGVICIFLKKNRRINAATARSWQRTTSTSFDGYLWLKDGTKILLTQSPRKEVALQKLQPFAEVLQAELRDLTEQRLA